MNTARIEYPRPQFKRSEWINLNGEWEFEIDNSLSGKEREFYKRDELNKKIIVPFCPESELSGIGNKDFMYSVWYRKNIEIPENWHGQRVILNFGAVDYKATVYVNGIEAGTHIGGYTPFSFDITDFIKEDGNFITVCAEDNVKDGCQPSGKQSQKFASYGCYYTRTTGIWQTVWMESVPKNHIENIKIDTDIYTPSVTLDILTPFSSSDYTLCAKAYLNNELVGEGETRVNYKNNKLNISLSKKLLWEAGKGNLYDLIIELKKGEEIVDRIASYFGLRKISVDDGAILLNDKKVFQRLVLDQGFYPDGIYTAKTEEELKNDILFSMKLGFNGARLHEKVFEPAYLYWADKLGYIVWGEYANWGYDHTDPSNIYNFLPQWVEAVKRDYNHPSIIGWCPFNETWDKNGKRQYDETIGMVYDITKELDSTRPVIDTSGAFHVRTDVYDVHDYEQNPEVFSKMMDKLDSDGIFLNAAERLYPNRQKYDGNPIFISEYGGIKWDGNAENNQNVSWGYGNAPKTSEEFVERYRLLTDFLLSNKRICGFCYTQLYDVEQEKNGLLTYDRKFKFEPEIFYKINTKKAEIEKEN